MGGLDGEDGEILGTSSAARRWGVKQAVYVYMTQGSLSSIICVCALQRRGSTYQDFEPMFKTNYIFPFLFSEETPAQCTMPLINNRHEKSRPSSLLLLLR